MPHHIRSPFITSLDGNTYQYTFHAMTVTPLTVCNTRCQQCLLDASSIDEVQSACTPDAPLLRYLFNGDTPWVDIKMVAGKWFVFDARYMQFIWDSPEERSVAIIFPLSTCNTIGAYMYRSLTFPYQRMADFTPWYQDPIGCVRSLIDRFSLTQHESFPLTTLVIPLVLLCLSFPVVTLHSPLSSRPYHSSASMFEFHVLTLSSVYTRCWSRLPLSQSECDVHD
jgi:hypothetical protein